MNRRSELVVVFRGNSIDAEIAKGILDANGIMVHIKNQLMGSIAPWQVSAGGFEPVEVQVRQQDAEKALQLLNDFNQKK